MHRRNGVIVLGVALLAAAAAFAPQTGQRAQAATQSVSVGNNFYSQTSITVNVGDTVQWNWPAAPNAVPHSVTSDSGTLLNSPVQATGTYSKAFDTPGTYTYHCEVHPAEMTGAVIVQAAPATATSTVVDPTDTPAATNTVSATSTGTATPAVTASSTPPPTVVPATPGLISGLTATATPSGGAAAGGTLPRTGDGAETAGGGAVRWAAVLLAAVGIVALGGAFVSRKRAWMRVCAWRRC